MVWHPQSLRWNFLLLFYYRIMFFPFHHLSNVMDGKGYENGFDVRNHYYGGPQKSIFSLQILCPTDTLGTSHKKRCCFWLSRTWTFVNLNENEGQKQNIYLAYYWSMPYNKIPFPSEVFLRNFFGCSYAYVAFGPHLQAGITLNKFCPEGW